MTQELSEFLPVDLSVEALSDEATYLGSLERLIKNRELVSALAVALLGMQMHSGSLVARIQLAHLFYRLECIPLALQQVEFVFDSHGGSSESVRRLLTKLDPQNPRLTASRARSETREHSSLALEEEEVLAETEFDFSELEDLERKE